MTAPVQTESRSSESQVTACFAERKSASPLPALPWSRGCMDTLLDTDSVLAGGSGERGSGPLKVGRPIPPFAFHYKYYKVRGMESTQAVPVNRSVEQLVPSPELSSLRAARPDVSLEDVKTWESSHRRSRAMLSSLDWQISSAVMTLQREYESDPSPALGKALRLLFSAGKSAFQLQRENATSLGNVLLKRRDAIIQRLPKQLPEEDRQALRSSSLGTDHLFDDAVTKVASSNMEAVLQRDAQLRAVNPPRRPTPRQVPGPKNQAAGKGKSVVVRPSPVQQTSQASRAQPRFSSNPQGRAAAPGDSRNFGRGRGGQKQSGGRSRGRRF